MYLEVNSQAPDFFLKNGDNQEIKLSDYRGKKVILYFYPKDDTSGCTKEACAFNDYRQDFSSLNAVIIGVSKDSVASHADFKQKYGLEFELLADPELTVIKQYGIWQVKKNYGKEYEGVVRSTYVINEDGIIEKVYKVYRVDGHVEKVLKDLTKAQNK